VLWGRKSDAVLKQPGAQSEKGTKVSKCLKLTETVQKALNYIMDEGIRTPAKSNKILKNKKPYMASGLQI
jgi:hypothetical protein